MNLALRRTPNQRRVHIVEPRQLSIHQRWLALSALTAASAVKLHIGGEITLVEIVLVVLAGWGLLQLNEPRDSAPWRWPVLGGIAVWLLGAIVADVVNHNSMQEALRGWTNIVLFAACIVGFIVLRRSGTRFLVECAIAILLGLAISDATAGTAYFRAEPWKFGFGTAVTLFALYLISFRLNRSLAPVLLLSLAALNLLGNYRTLFGILLVTALVTGLGLLTRKMTRGVRFVVLVGGMLLAAATIQLGSSVYGYAAENGVLGDTARMKFYWQSRGDANFANVLVGGRLETFATLRAISDSPVVGHGSWAADPTYVKFQAALAASRGLYVPGNFLTKTLIPNHSYILGTWMQHGFVAALFWFSVMVASVWAGLKAIFRASRLTPLLLFSAMFLTWNILFSPFLGTQRVVAAFLLVLLLTETHASGRAAGSHR